MKKRTVLLLTMPLMCLFFMNIQANATHVVAKVLYFQPTEPAFKDIYGSGMSYGGEVNINVFKNISIWVGAEYFSKKGELTFTKEETEIQIIPFYGGLKYTFPGQRIKPYLAAGVGYFRYKESNPIGTIEEGKIGFVAQAGLLLHLVGPVLIDLQAGYSLCKIKPQELEADIGGFKAGIGLGFSF